MRKKFLVFLMTGVIATTFAGCGISRDLNATPSTESEVIAFGDESDEEAIAISGGITYADSPEITDEIRQLVEAATSDLSDTIFSPLAYVGTQVVAGTNHLVLCEVVSAGHEMEPVYSLVYIYEDLEGNASVIAIDGSVPAHIYEKDVTGGWGATSSPVVTPEVKAALTMAAEGSDTIYTPLAYLNMQVVGGFNYETLCFVETPDYSYYSIVTIYESADGGAEIVSDQPLE